MNQQQSAYGALAWARGMAITGAVAAGIFIVWPLAAALLALWRWA